MATSSKVKAIRPVVHLMMVFFMFHSSHLMIMPFLIDIVMGTVCPGETECSRVIFLTGAQMLVSGIGTILLSPILGSVSDDYGRKPIFIMILFTGVVPTVFLAYRRTKVFVYTWWLLSIIVSIVRDAGLVPTALAYVADVIDDRHRGLAVGLTLASISLGYLVGTTAALFVSVKQALQAAAILQLLVAVYVKLFLIETNPRRLLLPADLEQSQLESTTKLLPRPIIKRHGTGLLEAAKTVQASPLLRTIALVDFLNSFGVSAMQSFLLYYLKAVFNYGKNEYAEIVIIGALGGAVGQMLIYPAMLQFTDERGVLRMALIGTAGHYLLYGLAWASWVPYAAAAAGLVVSLIAPAVGSLVSTVEHNQQGKVQGFMCGVRSAGLIIAPMMFTPLTAASLGDNPPFGIRGLAFVMCGAIMVAAWVISLMIPAAMPTADIEKPVDYIPVTLPPENFVYVTSPPEDYLQIPISRWP